MDITLATEDELSEAIGLRLIAEVGVHEIHPIRKNGNGYLRSKMQNWRQLASNNVDRIVLVLTDLDQKECPVALLEDWGARATPLPENLLLRIAVREAEAWVLADHEGMRKLIGSKAMLPPEPDTLPDPKQHLLGLARSAPRDVRQGLLPAKNVRASKGLAYNRILVDWIGRVWNPQRAAKRSPSLQRARDALKNSRLPSGS